MRLQAPRPFPIRPVLFLASLLTLTLALFSQTVHADAARWLPALYPRGTYPAQASPNTNVLVALSPISRTSPIELVSLTVDATITETDGHTLAQGNSTFKVHNTDTLDPITLTVGFPEWAGGDLSFDPGQFGDFGVTMDNRKVPLTVVAAPVQIGQASRTVNWYSFEIDLDPDEKKLVTANFTQDLGADIYPRFTYGLVPSNGWKGPIGSIRLSIHFPAPTLGDQFIALDPTIPQFDGQNVTWLWTGIDPDVNPGLTFIRLSTWNALVTQRAAVTQSPNSADSHLALARVYQQLAAEANPRQDNFMAQAVAELETAARLNPKSTDAVSTLAQLYETRAGPASGPRDIGYVQLALEQWQNLIGTRLDSNARKQAAEDSFYLGMDARSRGDNEQALRYFADAANFSPKGAGPLYTSEHWASETKAAHLTLALALADDSQIAQALAQARAALGNDFSLAPAPPLPSFALDHADITTTATERQIVLHLITYPGVSDDARQAVADVAAALNKTGAGSTALAATENDYVLTLTIPFNTDRDLQNKLIKLARAFPEREDWNVIREVVDAPAVEWREQEDTFTQAVHFDEQVDMASGLAPLQSNLDALGNTIAALEKAAPDDRAAQLRLKLLRDAQQWWQHALAAGGASYELQLPDAPAQHWNVKLGDKTALTYDRQAIRTQWYFIGAAGALAFLLLLTFLAFLVRAIRRRRA
jgi:hypothetical protein